MTETRSYSYKVVLANTNLPIALDDIKAHLKILSSDTSQDAYLTLLSKAVGTFAEKYTRRTLLTTTFQVYRDSFDSIIKLRRSRLISVDSFEYSVGYVYQAVSSSLYYVTDENDFSKIILKTDSEYPDDLDDRIQGIKIVFKAGYGATYTSIPADLYLALLNHVATVYENRGDCDSTLNQEMAFKFDTDNVTKSLPTVSRAVYNLYRIEDLQGDGYL